MTWTVAINPVSGRRPVDPGFIEAKLTGAGLDVVVSAPLGREEMAAVIDEGVADRHDGFIVVGGDGTLGLAVDTLLRHEWAEPPVLGVLPTGSGSDFIRTFALPRSLEAATTRLARGDTYTVDAVSIEGSFGTRMALNVVQGGIGAAAARTAARLSRSMGGARYSLAFASRFPGLRRVDVRVEAGRRSYEGPAAAVIFANGQFFAGGWNIAPKAMLVDGEVDVQVIDARIRDAVRLVPRIVRGVHLGDRSVRRWSAPRFLLETGVPWPVEADGDHLGTTPIEGRVLPGAIRFLI
ncbi:MAG TPA: diacylglycerol kinase family protein [Acidimicrobiia bacterium]|nr:diacylglycerol kinase family protein [Acidimicrobiia bacterium]